MLDIDWTTLRLFLHVLAASVWVGGQLTLVALLPVLRALDHSAPRLAARRFNQIAWPAYGVLVLTGVWNLLAESDELHGPYATTVAVKTTVVAVSGVTAFGHTRARTPRGVALLGALSGVSALAALFLGMMLGS